jgi:hypothetical protein
MQYDTIIVGAGIAGLRVGIELLTKKKQTCCILEKYKYNGGRVTTYHTHLKKIGAVQWENGAGRISTHHTRVLHLLKKYGLHTVPLSADSTYQGRPSQFTALLPIFLEPLSALSPAVLQQHTLKQLLEKCWGSHAKQFYLQFPYYAEMHVLRADVALQAFQHEMRSQAGFVVCQEGLSTLIQSMVKEFEELGGVILQDWTVTGIRSSSRSSGMCLQGNTPKKQLHCHTCVLALHSNAVQHIKGVNHMPVLRHLTMQPLLRIYAVFPLRNGRAWFADLPKTVVSGPLRYIIPVNAAKGIIMISYTEGRDAAYWLRFPLSSVQDRIMHEVRALYPTMNIPDPFFFKMHPWQAGTTYWRPGTYSVAEASRRALHPLPAEFPRLFMCGESFAVHQAWMESAVEHADLLLETHLL